MGAKLAITLVKHFSVPAVHAVASYTGPSYYGASPSSVAIRASCTPFFTPSFSRMPDVSQRPPDLRLRHPKAGNFSLGFPISACCEPRKARRQDEENSGRLVELDSFPGCGPPPQYLADVSILSSL